MNCGLTPAALVKLEVFAFTHLHRGDDNTPNYPKSRSYCQNIVHILNICL